MAFRQLPEKRMYEKSLLDQNARGRKDAKMQKENFQETLINHEHLRISQEFTEISSRHVSD
jgi:hypothetical protein